MMHPAIWDFWAPRYERLYAQTFALGPTRRMVLDHLDAVAPRAARILDLGCGIGQLAAELAGRRPAARITAIDPSPGMIERAGRDFARPGITYLIGALDDLPQNESYDAIVSTHAFPYLADKPRALARLRGMLRPGGRLIIVQGNTQNLYDRLFYLGIKLTVSKAEYLSTRALAHLLTAAGFTLGAVTPLPRAWFIPSVYLVEGIVST